MARISILIAFLLHLLCAMAQRQQSPCSEYFTYMTKPGITDMLGQIKISPPSANDIFYLRVALSTITELGQIVRLELARSIKESVRHVYQGRPLLYHVYYPMNEQIPSLSAIWFNSQRYCPDSEVSGNITANIELVHILFPPNKEPLVYGLWQEISQPYHRNLSSYRIDNPSYDRLNHYSGLNECGITSYYTDDTNRLMGNGEPTLPGQWPWVTAIYEQNTDNENKYFFRCIGSILTTRHVITSGICMYVWKEDRTLELINPQRIYVCFGQLKSREWHGNHTGIISRMVVDYKISSEDLQNYANLAILILKTAVQYNAFIKPICLWSGSTNIQDTKNMTGYIVGWGDNYIRSEPGRAIWEIYTGELRMGKQRLINILESPVTDYFIYYNSDYYCHTDLGGGLMVFNTTTGRYQLRAVMWNCTTFVPATRYVNVANLTSWIQQQILLT